MLVFIGMVLLGFILGFTGVIDLEKWDKEKWW